MDNKTSQKEEYHKTNDKIILKNKHPHNYKKEKSLNCH